MGPIWISESDIRLDMPKSIALLRNAMKRQASGQALNMEKTHVPFPGGSMHAIGAAFADAALLGVKTWAHTPKGATPLEILWDAETGKLLAIIEAFAMGQFRTAGMAGLVTDCLSARDADLLTICGTGKQALAQVAAVAAIRPLHTVRVFGRSTDRRAGFCTRVQTELNLKTEEFSDVAAAVRNSPIITLVTRAKEPFLTEDMPARGAHINAMGAITPERQEFTPELLARCAIVAVDSVAQAKAVSSELIAATDAKFAWPEPISVSDLVSHHETRPRDADLTLFKSVGIGIADLALAEEIYRVARASNAGRELPVPAPAPLSFRQS